MDSEHNPKQVAERLRYRGMQILARRVVTLAMLAATFSVALSVAVVSYLA